MDVEAIVREAAEEIQLAVLFGGPNCGGLAYIISAAIRTATASVEAERDAAQAECLSLQATIRKLTAPIEADEYPMPARNDPSFAAKRLAFAREANERVWDALQVEGHPCASDLWSKEGKAAKAAGLYAPSTYYADAGSGLKGKLRNAGIPVAGDWNAKRASAAPASEAPDGPAPARKGDQ